VLLLGLQDVLEQIAAAVVAEAPGQLDPRVEGVRLSSWAS